MVKLKLFTILTVTIAALGVAALSDSSADPSAPQACIRKVFKTKMIKEACTSKPAGGRETAKVAMQKFAADHKVKCTECHTTFAPDYKIKDTAFKRYQELGGK
jgi:hypothetical protein